MKFSTPLYKNKKQPKKAASAKNKASAAAPKKKTSQQYLTGKQLREARHSRARFREDLVGYRIKPPRNNLQLLYKRKSQINQKMRVRKFKTRTTQSTPIRRTSAGLKVPRRASLVGLKMRTAVRFSYATLIGMEKTFMLSRGKCKLYYRKFPALFVTKKSSKSRMGKGKGKIGSRIMKIRRNEVIVDIRLKNYIKHRRFIKAVKSAIPSTTQVVFKNRWVRRHILTGKFMRPWLAHRVQKKRKKQWQIDLERAGLAAKLKRRVPGVKRYYYFPENFDIFAARAKLSKFFRT
jgi:ribosomal protein L16/L10AE